MDMDDSIVFLCYSLDLFCMFSLLSMYSSYNLKLCEFNSIVITL